MKKIVFALGFLLLLACAEKVVEKPENLIPKDKMIDILHDLALLNATRTTIGTKMEDMGVETMEFLYNRYQIDSLQFSQSDLYYASIPVEYQAIYTAVEARLEARVKAMEESAAIRTDSIRKATEKRQDSINRSRKGDSLIANP